MTMICRRSGLVGNSGEVVAESGGDGCEVASSKSMAGTVGVGQRRSSSPEGLSEATRSKLR